LTSLVMLPSTGSTVSAHGITVISELNPRAWVYPCRYHTHDVTIVSVRLRAGVSG
jgi:hypothetical protein